MNGLIRRVVGDAAAGVGALGATGVVRATDAGIGVGVDAGVPPIRGAADGSGRAGVATGAATSLVGVTDGVGAVGVAGVAGRAAAGVALTDGVRGAGNAGAAAPGVGRRVVTGT
jgi:hypothetical protein